MSGSWGKFVSIVSTHKAKIGAGAGILVLVLGAIANATQVLDFVGLTPSKAPVITTEPETVFELISMTEHVRCGSDAEVSVSTISGTMCFLAYTTPKGNVSEADGLGATTANSEGRCYWKWHISARTGPGKGTVSIKIGDVERSYSIEVTQ